jgi:hypothetical protein
VVTFSPLKVLGAGGGILLVASGFLLSDFVRSTFRILILFATYAALSLLHHLFEPSSTVLGTALFVVSYSQFALLLLRPTVILTDRDRRGMINLLTVASWTQGSLGILQAVTGRLVTGTFDGSNGDVVSGTIGLYTSEPRGSNVFFAIAILSTSLLILALAPHLKGLVRALPGFVAFVVASVLHLQLVAAVAALVAIILMLALRFSPSKKVTRMDLLAPGTMVLVMAIGTVVTPSNYGNYDNYVVSEVESLLVNDAGDAVPEQTVPEQTVPEQTVPEQTVPEQTTPSDRFRNHKLKMAVRTLLELPEISPYQPLLGVGAGQFNSRAALIATGSYLEGLSMPTSWSGISQSSQELFFPLYDSGIPSWAGSAWFPYFSIQSLYAELGILGVALAGTAIARASRKLLRIHQPGNGVPALIGLAWFLFGIGFYENYWEWTQGIVLPLFLLWVAVNRSDEFFLKCDRVTKPNDAT